MKTHLLVVLAVALGAAEARCEPLEKLARRLEKGLSAQENRKVAVLAFPDLKGGVNQGSLLVQERLTTYLARRGKVEVIERSRLDQVLSEMKLQHSGIVDPAGAQKVGKVLGAAALVIGTLGEPSEGKVEVNARLVRAETGQILAADAARIEKAWTDEPTVRLPPVDPPAPARRRQVALILDTSNSMDGLIAQAKSQLWGIVNELARSEKGERSTVEVALYEYGNNGVPAENRYVRRVLPFTKDLDRVSEALFALTTNGGEEYAGAAIAEAVSGLDWDRSPGVYRTMFVAGNEPFTQGPVAFQGAAESARAKGIVVNTIFCGGRQEGIATQWLAGARAGGGDYMVIDQNERFAALRAPQDDELERLSQELSSTYVPYGDQGRRAHERQKSQDAAARGMAAQGAGVQRAMFKAGKQYAAAAWDAVSVLAASPSASFKKEDLPAEMGAMEEAELKDHLKKQAGRRERIQGRMNELADQRRAWAEKNKEGEGRTLGEAVSAAVRAQLEATPGTLREPGVERKFPTEGVR